MARVDSQNVLNGLQTVRTHQRIAGKQANENPGEGWEDDAAGLSAVAYVVERVLSKSEREVK
ncbi:hypothetical protein BRC81_00175 [Halobacteriales archaeon QS_1_68_20]|nr:MAG: hypothetical protein BRC81_00175 [Halobacteriales archaeon QS_1_68_20]